MLKFVSILACLAAASQVLAQQETTTGSSFQNFFKKVQEAGANVDFAKLSADAIKAKETLGPMLSQFKQVSQPIQNKLAEVGLVPTTTANPVGGVLKHLQMVGIGSDVDVGKFQENTKKAQDTLGPVFSQFSSFFNKKSSSGGSQPAASASKSPIDDFIIEDPKPAAAAAAPPAAPPAVSTSSKSNDLQNALKTIQDVGSKIDINQVQEGAKKVQSFFSQFKNSGTS